MADKALSIAQVAQLSRVTSRTLRHYDDIGLLPPAHTDSSGRRFYQREQLVRLLKADRLAKEAAERWGDTVTASHQRSKRWSKEKWDEVNAQGAVATQQLADLAKAGVPVDDDRVLDAADEHYRWILSHWTPDAESYAGLGRVYAADERFRTRYEAIHPGFADYLRDALAAYAAARL